MPMSPEILVRINGEMTGFHRALTQSQARLKSWGREIEGAFSSRLTQALGAGALAAGLRTAFQAADDFDASQRKLASTAAITGQNLGFLQKSALDAKNAFGLSAQTANEFAIEISKLTGKAGQIEKTGEAIGAFLNLGAARGYGAADTLQAVQQAILGIDEGTDKLFGKNPSVIYAEFAQKVGLSAGKMTDAQKAMALLDAAMNDGGKVATAYAEHLKSPQGQAEQLRQKMQETAVSIGKSMNGVRLAVMPGLAVMAEGLRKFIGGIQLLAVDAAVGLGRVKLAFLEFRDWLNQVVGGSNRGRADGFRPEFERMKAEARRLQAEIVREMDLAMEISGDTSPIHNVVTSVGDAATEASKKAAKLREEIERLDRVLRSRAVIPGVLGAADPDALLRLRIRGGAALREEERQRRRVELEGLGGTLDLARASDRGVPSPRDEKKAAGAEILDAVKGQFLPAVSLAGGALLALAPIFQGLKDTIAPAIQGLTVPLREAGRVIGSLLLPVLKVLFEPMRVLGIVVAMLGESVARVAGAFFDVMAGLKDALGSLLIGVGKLLNAIPDGKDMGKGLISWGRDMKEGAERYKLNGRMAREMAEEFELTQKELRELSWEEATQATEELTRSMQNVPSGFKVNAARFNATVADVTGDVTKLKRTMDAKTSTGTTSIEIGEVNIHEVTDGPGIYEEFRQELTRRARASGPEAQRLALAFPQ